MIMIVVVLTFLPGCAQQNGDSPANKHDKPEETFTDSAYITDTADALEAIAQLTREEIDNKVDLAALDIGYIAAKDTFAEVDFGRRGPPVDAVTHLMLNGSLVELEDLLIMRQLESELPYLADILDDTNIKWYHDGTLLCSVQEVYEALEKDWTRIISPSILEDENILDGSPEEPAPRYFDGIGAMDVSPSGRKLAFDLDFTGACAVRICAAGIIDLEDKEVFFTNIGKGDLALKKNWSPDEQYLAYISSHDGPGAEWLHVDDIREKQNIFTVDAGKINAALKKEGQATLHPRGPGLVYKDVSWSSDGPLLYFAADMSNAVWQETNENEIKEINFLLDLQNKELQIKSITELTARFTEEVEVKVLETKWEVFNKDYIFPTKIHDNLLTYLEVTESGDENVLVVNSVNLFNLKTGEINEIVQTYYEQDMKATSSMGIHPGSWWTFQWFEEKLLLYSHNEIVLYDLEKLDIISHKVFFEDGLDLSSSERSIHGVTFCEHKDLFAVILDQRVLDSNVPEDKSAKLTLLDLDLNEKDKIAPVNATGRGEAGFYYHNMHFIDQQRILLCENVHRKHSDSVNAFQINLEDNSVEKVVSLEGFDVIKSIHPSPDGEMIYAWQHNYGKPEDTWRRVYDNQGNEKAKFGLDTGHNFAWSPDGSILALTDKIWHKDKGVLEYIDFSSQGTFRWSSDGQWLFDGEKLWNREKGLVDEFDIGDKGVIGFDGSNRLWLAEL